MSKNLEIGKLPNEILENLVLNKIKEKREEVLVGSSIGEDTAVLDFKDNYIVMSCDPITGSSSNIGKLGVHISVNDVSTRGAEPVGILLTLLLPPKTKEEEISEIMDEISREIDSLNMDIIGGHTEITNVVSRPVLVTTVVGKVKKEEMPKKEIIKPGFIIAMTKTAGLEGTAIIAAEKEDLLKNKISQGLFSQAMDQFDNISVMTEGILSRQYRVGYMHDVTEGGIEGAVWEASKAIGKGISIEKKSIPILESTKEVCRIFNLDPYKLISSGSMLIIIDPDDYNLFKKDLEEKKILLTKIGYVGEGEEIEYIDEEKNIPILSPGVDELYKVV